MDSIDKYRDLVKQLLTDYAALENRPPTGEAETHLVFDQDRDHYMMFRTGWWQDKRIRATALYVRLHNGKIWIEEDMTEDGLAADLLAANVPHQDIVLAFRHPDIRPYTEFAVA